MAGRREDWKRVAEELRRANVHLAQTLMERNALLAVTTWRLGGKVSVSVTDARKLNLPECVPVNGKVGEYLLTVRRKEGVN